jgi:hypothetical protein
LMGRLFASGYHTEIGHAKTTILRVNDFLK